MPQNSRNKNLLLSTPYLFQRQLYDFLCLETRLNLRKCSKRCQSLVDNMPLTLDFLAIKASSYVNIKYSESKIHTEDEYVSSYIAILILCGDKKEEPTECHAKEAADEIGIILLNPNLKIGNLHLKVANEVRNIQYKEKVGSLLAIFLKHLKSIISSLPHQINVQHFSLGGNLLTPENYCELLSSLKSEKLESISLFGERTGDSLDKIAHLEQIKRVPSIEIRHVVDRIPFDMLSNTPNYLINVRNISELEFIRIVEHHLQRDNFEMGRFCVMKSDMEPWITDFLVKNAAVNKDDGSMTVTLEGPKFKNTVNVDDEWIVFRRMI